jgi:hypothetical protein
MEEVFFSEPFHQRAGVEQRFQGREYAGHQRQVVAGSRDTAEVPFRIGGHFHREKVAMVPMEDMSDTCSVITQGER